MPNTFLTQIKRRASQLDLRRPASRNFLLGVINGAVFRVSMVMIDSEVVLSWFLSQLGVSNFLIGAVPSIRMGSSFLLQIGVSGYLQQYPYKLPYYRTLSVIRFLALMGLAAAVAWLPLSSPWLVPVFYVLLTSYSMMAGLGSLGFMDVVGKVIPARRRGAFFGLRSFWGGILALGASPFVGYILTEPDGLAFPVNVALLFVLAAVTLGTAAGLWSLVQEPPSEVSSGRVPVWAQVRRGVGLLRENGAYRTFLLSRLAAALASSAGPFYIVYAKTTLGISPQMAGVYLTARTAAMIASNLLWGRISDRKGNRRLLQVATALGLSMPLGALVIGAIANRVSLLPGSSALLGLSWTYGLVYAASGALLAGINIGSPGYLLSVAPPAERPLYLGFTNTLFGVVRFVSMLSGVVVDRAGFAVLLGLSAGFYALALVLSLMMVDLRGGSAD